MKCPYCYNEQIDGSAFCEKCGANLKPAAQRQDNPFQPSQPQQNMYPPDSQQQGGQQPYNPYGQQNQQGNNPYGQQGQGNIYQPPNQQNADYERYAKQAKTALICGIISLFCAGMILGIVAIVQGAQASKSLKSIGAPTGNATAGIILGIIGLVGWALSLIFLPSLWSSLFMFSY